MKTASQAIANFKRSSKPVDLTPTKSVELWAKWLGFDLRKGSPDEKQMVAMVEACARFVKAMKSGGQPYWISMIGTSGAGKTFLAKRIFRWHRACGNFNSGTTNERGFEEVVYSREWCWWPSLAGLLKGNDGYGQLRDVESSAFSVIDEIGAELDKSGHVTNCLANMLCGRVGKWTIVTSNRSMKEIEVGIDPRVASRMIRDGSEVLDVNAEDYSLWKKRQNESENEQCQKDISLTRGLTTSRSGSSTEFGSSGNCIKRSLWTS